MSRPSRYSAHSVPPMYVQVFTRFIQLNQDPVFKFRLPAIIDRAIMAKVPNAAAVFSSKRIATVKTPGNLYSKSQSASVRGTQSMGTLTYLPDCSPLSLVSLAAEKLCRVSSVSASDSESDPRSANFERKSDEHSSLVQCAEVMLVACASHRTVHV